MDSLRDHKVYVREDARPGGEQVTPVPNVYTAGIASLAEPLAEYKAIFDNMKKRRAMTPIIGKSILETHGITRPIPISTPSPSEPPHADTAIHDGDTLSSNGSQSEFGSESSDSKQGGEEAADELALVGEVDLRGPGDVFFALETAQDVELDMDGY